MTLGKKRPVKDEDIEFRGSVHHELDQSVHSDFTSRTRSRDVDESASSEPSEACEQSSSPAQHDSKVGNEMFDQLEEIRAQVKTMGEKLVEVVRSQEQARRTQTPAPQVRKRQREENEERTSRESTAHKHKPFEEVTCEGRARREARVEKTEEEGEEEVAEAASRQTFVTGPLEERWTQESLVDSHFRFAEDLFNKYADLEHLGSGKVERVIRRFRKAAVAHVRKEQDLMVERTAGQREQDQKEEWEEGQHDQKKRRMLANVGSY